MNTEDIKIGDLVIFKNNQFIAFNKPFGLPTQGDKTGDKSLLDLAEIYCKCSLHPIHRVDRPAGGIVLFAKNKKSAAALFEQFRNREVKKSYMAVVGTLPKAEDGRLEHYLVKDGRKNVSRAVDKDAKGAKLAQLDYKHLGDSEKYHLLELDLLTGRHHQIRAQLAAAGAPIKGDVKYGFRRSNKDRSIHLLAKKLVFKHPVSKEEVTLEVPFPDEVVWQAFNI